MDGRAGLGLLRSSSHEGRSEGIGNWTFKVVSTLQELTALDVGFVSLSEALDLTTPSGRALAGMLAVFAEFERDILRDQVKAGIDQARKDGKPHGRPMTAGKLVPEMKQLRKDGISKRAIAKQLGVSRTSVYPVATLQEALLERTLGPIRIMFEVRRFTIGDASPTWSRAGMTLAGARETLNKEYS